MRTYARSEQPIAVPMDDAGKSAKCSMSLGMAPLVVLTVFAAMYAVMAAVLLSVIRL